MVLAAPLVGAVTGAVTESAPPEVELALWHGVNVALILSLLAVAGGVVLLWQHGRLLDRWERLSLPDAKRLFELTLGLADRFTRKAIVASHTPSLQTMLLASFAVIVLLVIEGTLAGGGTLTGTRAGLPAPLPAVVAWFLLVAATCAVVVQSHNRLRALIIVSVIGLVVSLAFAVLSAPDLALTQISVEVVTVLLLLLALNLLPKTPPLLSSPTRKARDAALAIAGGVLVGGIAWAMLTRDPGPSIAAFHLANAKPGGGGTNVVNVILVDFRAFDTLGEISVVAVAGLGVIALLKARMSKKGGAE